MSKLKPLKRRCADNYCKSKVDSEYFTNLCRRHYKKQQEANKRKALFA